MKNLSVRNEDSDIPCKADVDEHLKNVPNVGTNDQTPTYSTATTLAKLVTGEKLGIAFGKIAKAVDELITHLSDSVKHITAAERTAWNGKAAGNHTHSNMTAATASAAGKAGLVPAPAAGAQTKYLRGDGTWQTPPDTNTTYSNMKGATADAAGTAGLVPAPAKGNQAKYLRGDGTWQTPPDTNTTYSAATQTAAGLMSAADKKKLDSGYVVKSDDGGLYVEI